MNPQVRTGITHAGTALGGAIAALSFASSHSVDLYAIFNQFNVVVAEVGKLIALVTPFATATYGIFKSTTKQRLNDLAQNPDIKGIVTTPDIANAVPSAKVVSTAAAMPQLAHEAKATDKPKE